MALTVTVAGSSSDSYATVAEADAFLSWRSNAAWEAAVDATKEAVLKEAVSLMDRLQYKSPKSATAQALRLPHATMTQSDGTYYIPDRIKRAQTLLAMYLLNDPDAFTGTGNVRQVSVPGGFSVTFADAGGGFMLPVDVLHYLDGDLWKWGPSATTWDSAARRWV